MRVTWYTGRLWNLLNLHWKKSKEKCFKPITIKKFVYFKRSCMPPVTAQRDLDQNNTSPTVAGNKCVRCCAQPLGGRTVLQSCCCCSSEWSGLFPMSPPDLPHPHTYRTPVTPGRSRSWWAPWTRTTTGSWLSPSSGSSLTNREASVRRACRLWLWVDCATSISSIKAVPKLKGILLMAPATCVTL